MRRKILITGGAGFIGTHLAEGLRLDNKLILFDNLSRNSLRFMPSLENDANVKFVQGDVLDKDQLRRQMEGVDVVLHLAAIAGVSNYYKHSTRTLKVNIFGTVNVLDAMVETGVKQIIDFSTSEVFGGEARNVNEESNHAIGPVSQKRWVYAVSKLASEHFTLRYGEDHDQDGWVATCVRPFNIYGPRQTGEGAISNFVTNLLKGEPIKIYGEGNDVRAWCYVSDLVDAIKLILENPRAKGKTLNIGNPNEIVSSLQLAQLVVDIYGKGRIRHVPQEHDPIIFRSPDISRACQYLGYMPKVGLREGLCRTIQWFRKEVTA